MAKFFKIIVNIVIIICILAVVALVVPPLVGVEEKIAEPQMDTNVSEGTVLYGTKRPVSMTAAGDEIIYDGDGFLYLYTVEAVDTANDEVSVINKVSGEQSVLQISKSVIKNVLAVPFIGYIMIATRSTEGIAMLISAAVVLIMLAIVAELCRKKAYPDEEYEEDEDEEEYFSDIVKDMGKTASYEAQYNAGAVSAQAAAAASVTEPAVRQAEGTETSQAAQETEALEGQTIILPAKPEAAAGEAQAVLSETGSAAAEVPAGTAGIPAETIAAAKEIPAASYSAESMAEAFEDVPEDKSAATLNMSDDEIPDVSDALVAALATTQVNRSDYYQQVRQPVEEIPEEPVDEIELAIPVLSAEEILDAAYKKGEDPGVTKDEVTGVTLIDFSDCLN